MAKPFKLSACVIVKNEARFIAEWLEYHLHTGFEHFYVYDNNSSDNLQEVLDRYSGLVSYVHWPLTDGQQRAAYQHYFEHHGADSEWTAFIDADEFVAYRGEGNLQTYLCEKRNENGIMMQWHLFGTSGHDKRPAGLVLENYTRRHLHSPDPNIKTVCRPAEVCFQKIVSPHRFPYKDGRPGLPETTDVIAVFHYVTRSREDLYLKITRGDVWSAERTEKNLANVQAIINEKLKLYDQTDFDDRYMLQFVPAVRARLSARMNRLARTERPE